MTNMESRKNEKNILEVNNLTIDIHSFAGVVQAVRGVSFTLKKGETLAIVGESGSGKSVTNRAIMGILSNNSIIRTGDILYENQNLAHFTDKEFNAIRGSKISMIFQDPMSSLDPVMKIGKQITEALHANKKLGKKEAKEKAIELMKSVGIPHAEDRFNQYPFQFSGGMRQRIVIAIALACEPEILICDEPTTALDVSIQSQILELIKNLQEELQLTVIFITHDLGVVAEIADRVAVMYAGKIVEYGLLDEIFYDPKHPYTWALMSAMPDLDMKQEEELLSIPGTPPNMIYPPEGDAFADRNAYALEIDFKKEPPFFKVSDTHFAATWLLDPRAPVVEKPAVLQRRINNRMKEGGLSHD